jgi:UDP-N-acetylglucosamine transferase subunit ALG13
MATLLVANTGGHLTQLHHLRPRLRGVDSDVIWVTFDTPQSRSLLRGEDVIHVPFTGTRDYRHVLANTREARRILRRPEVTGVVSTGAAIALSFLPLARAMGLPAHYVESATRADGPSATGRLLAKVPGIGLHTQHAAWAGDRWRFAGSVFDGYESHFKRFPSSKIRRAVVTLGQHDFGFRRLAERLVEIMPADAEVLWQTGSTDVTGLGIDAQPSVPEHVLRAAIEDADVVVSHAGIGSLICALEARRCPVIVPRRAAHGEHVDDHQVEIMEALRKTDIAVAREVEELTLEDLVFAAELKVGRVEEPRPVVLGPPETAGVVLDAPAQPSRPEPAPSATIG